MSAVIGRAWGWVRFRGSSVPSENAATVIAEGQKRGSSGGGGLRGWTSWMWGGSKRQIDHSGPVEEFWEAQEKLQPMEIEDLGAGRLEKELGRSPRWWNKYLPTTYLPWSGRTEPSGLRRRKGDGRSGNAWDPDVDGDFSDYGTPPPSPTPPSPLTSPFRLFAQSWKLEILPEHYDICFNFLRHLFDLFVVGFLWTVSPPTKLILEVLGVQGAMRLWLHGMAMFFVSTVGMAGLLWLIQEYLPQFALIYGIVQAVVISVSVKQSVVFGMDEEQEQKQEEVKSEVKESREHKEKLVTGMEKMKKS